MRGFIFAIASSAPILMMPQAGPATSGESPAGHVRVAAVQMAGYDKTDMPRPGFDPCAPVIEYIRRAAKEGSRLIVFPEYLLGRISIPGPETERISRAAAEGGICVVVGCWEVQEDGAFANTALLFDAMGKIVGKYHKVHAAVDYFEGEPPWRHPPAGKDLEWFIRNDPEWAMKRGDDFPVFELDFGRVGILTCYDGWFPESFRILSLKGAEMIIWINGRRGRVEDFIVRSAAFQNEIAVVAVNQSYGSGTVIAQWPANILGQCNESKEAYVTAAIDLARIRRARQNSRNARQRRPEVYGEIVKPSTVP